MYLLQKQSNQMFAKLVIVLYLTDSWGSFFTTSDNLFSQPWDTYFLTICILKICKEKEINLSSLAGKNVKMISEHRSHILHKN